MSADYLSNGQFVEAIPHLLLFTNFHGLIASMEVTTFTFTATFTKFRGRDQSMEAIMIAASHTHYPFNAPPDCGSAYPQPQACASKRLSHSSEVLRLANRDTISST